MRKVPTEYLPFCARYGTSLCAIRHEVRDGMSGRHGGDPEPVRAGIRYRGDDPRGEQVPQRPGKENRYVASGSDSDVIADPDPQE